MNRIMMEGKERGEASEMRNFHFEYSSCENMCVWGGEETLADPGSREVRCKGEILNIVCIIVSNSSWKVKLRLRRDNI
jgi:hypothetical protein